MKPAFKNFGPETIIYSEGHWPNEAYRILRGNVEISVGSAGRRFITGTLGAGDVFGEMSLLQQRPREVTARALNDTDLEIIQTGEFLTELSKDPKALSRYLDQVFGRLRATSERLRTEILKHGEGPFAANTETHSQTLGEHAGQPPENGAKPPNFEIRMHCNLQPLFHQVINHFPFLVGRNCEPPLSSVDPTSTGNSYQFELINELSPAPSAPHCAIELIDDACFIRDLDSETGTLVNGLRIGQRARDDIARLKPGLNHIILGDPSSPYQITVAVNPAQQSS